MSAGAVGVVGADEVDARLAVAGRGVGFLGDVPAAELEADGLVEAGGRARRLRPAGNGGGRRVFEASTVMWRRPALSPLGEVAGRDGALPGARARAPAVLARAALDRSEQQLPRLPGPRRPCLEIIGLSHHAARIVPRGIKRQCAWA